MRDSPLSFIGLLQPFLGFIEFELSSGTDHGLGRIQKIVTSNTPCHHFTAAPLVYTRDDIVVAIEAHRSEAADALEAIQLGDTSADEEGAATRKPLSAAGLDVAADAVGDDRAEFWVEMIESRDLLAAFAVALHARGVDIDLTPVPLAAGHVGFVDAALFPAQAQSFRCQVLRGDDISGSGVLVGPSTVLTAWHVVASPIIYDPAGVISNINVRLSDGRIFAATVVASSPCSEYEFAAQMPSNDEAFDNLHDMALLKLNVPVGAALGFAELSAGRQPFKSRRPLYLVHYPNGANLGLAEGVTGKITNIKARAGHNAPAAQGSSGGGCFDTQRKLIGIHQGRQKNGDGRYVPLERFAVEARAVVANDVAPPTLWSETDTPEGRLIIGRGSLFQAYAAALGNGRIRGIHVKRANPEDGPSELSFTYDILRNLIARSPSSRLCRIALGTLVEDIPAEVVRRVADSGLAIKALEDQPGVAKGESAPEAVGADRGQRAADLVNDAAVAAGLTIWLYFDQPAVSFGDEQRSAMEGIIGKALRLPNIRIVVAGLEAAAVPGQDYYPGGPIEGAAGLMIDYIRGFGRPEVIEAITLAARAAKTDLGIAGAGALADGVLDGMPQINGILAASLSGEVAARLGAPIRGFFKVQAHV